MTANKQEGLVMLIASGGGSVQWLFQQSAVDSDYMTTGSLVATKNIGAYSNNSIFKDDSPRKRKINGYEADRIKIYARG